MATKASQRIILPSGAESVNFLTDISTKDVATLLSLKIESIHLGLDASDYLSYVLQMGFIEDHLFEELDEHWVSLYKRQELADKVLDTLGNLGYDLSDYKNIRA